MAVQDILLIAGFVFLAAALGLGIVAFYVFRKEDIPAVLADLSGKTRQLGIDGQGGAQNASRPREKAGIGGRLRVGADKKARGHEGDAFDPDAPTGVLERAAFNPDAPTDVADGPDAPTLVASKRRAAGGAAALGDDSPTSVAAVGDGSPTSPAVPAGDDSVTTVAAPGLDTPTTILPLQGSEGDGGDIDSRTTVLTPRFSVIRSELRINSDVVITLGKDDR